MSEKIYLMNPHTGSVDTEENWITDSQDWLYANGEIMHIKDRWMLIDELKEVEKDFEGNWIEKKENL